MATITESITSEDRVYLYSKHTGHLVCIRVDGNRGCAGYTLETSFANRATKTHHSYNGAAYRVMTKVEVDEFREILPHLHNTVICDCRY